MIRSANLGFPRIGARRELKKALEAYWKGDGDLTALKTTRRRPARAALAASKGSGRRHHSFQ